MLMRGRPPSLFAQRASAATRIDPIDGLLVLLCYKVFVGSEDSG